jgi:hypothetical protein
MAKAIFFSLQAVTMRCYTPSTIDRSPIFYEFTVSRIDCMFSFASIIAASIAASAKRNARWLRVRAPMLAAVT